MKIKPIILTIAIFMTVVVAAQNDTSNSKSTRQISILIGGLHNQIRDDIVVPLRWDGMGFLGSFSYTLIGYKVQHHIELCVPLAFPSNRYDHESTIVGINLEYEFLPKISNSVSIGQIYLGGKIGWNYNIQFYNSWDDSHLYWLNVYEIGPAVRWSKTVGDNHQLAANFTIPLLALISRPPEYRYYDQFKPSQILSETHDNMVFTSLHEYISISLGGQYLYQVSSRILLGLSYNFSCKTYSKPDRISLITNTLQLKLVFTR